VGQATRICVIRSLLLKPEVLLLDEPTAALDPRNTDIFFRTFEEMRANRKFATVWVTHDPERAKDMAGRHLFMKDGTLHE
jgi:ABC-type lipoprotein export system ATPase subunit